VCTGFACLSRPLSHRLVSFRQYYNEKPGTQESANTQPLTASELEDFQSFLSPAGFSPDNSILRQLQPPSPRTASDGAKASSNPFAIDPSLVQQGTSPAAPQSVATEDCDMSLDPEEDDDDDDDIEEASAATSEKGGRRKSATPGATTRKSGTGKLPHLKFDVPEYADKPSADEYKKLSSSLSTVSSPVFSVTNFLFSGKEKRQLRNKISARNFRHRRKGN
jgi:hypothetical protein